MTALTIALYILGTLAVLGAVVMVVAKHPMRSAMALLFVILVLSGMYALLSAPFIAVLQLIIYAGAIMTLLIFIVTLVDVQGDDLHKTYSKIGLLALPVLLGFFLMAFLLFGKSHLLAESTADFGSVQNISKALFSQYFLHFEIASLLLFVGIIGVSVLRGKK